MQYVVSTLLQKLFINTIAEGHGICLQDVPSSTQPTPCPPALRLASDFHSNKKRRNGHLCVQCPLLDVRVLPSRVDQSPSRVDQSPGRNQEVSASGSSENQCQVSKARNHHRRPVCAGSGVRRRRSWELGLPKRSTQTTRGASWEYGLQRDSINEGITWSG